MNPATTGRRIVTAVADIDGPTRARLADLFAEYAEHLAATGNVTVARLFLELGHAAADGTTDEDKLTADFVAIAATLPPRPFGLEDN